MEYHMNFSRYWEKVTVVVIQQIYDRRLIVSYIMPGFPQISQINADGWTYLRKSAESAGEFSKIAALKTDSKSLNFYS
jgi:hypothetical protein